MSEIYNIVYAADDSFSSVLGTSICSLLDNNREAKRINIYIIDGGIKKLSKEKILDIENKYKNADIKWVTVESISNRLGIEVQKDRGSLSQFSRLFVGNIFSKKIKRVLYLDCDTIVISSIKNLWNLNLKGKTISALKDAFSKYYRKNIELSENDIMFNSGIMLIDLERWRQKEIEKKVLSFISRKKGKIQQGDQGALNSILSKDTLPLPPQYNLVSIFYELTFSEIKLYRSPCNFYSNREINLAKKNPVIIHYTSSFYSIRPWFENSNHPMKNIWLEYYKKTPWYTEKLKYENSRKKKLVVRLTKFGMRKPILFCAGFFQKYLRPLKNSL